MTGKQSNRSELRKVLAVDFRLRDADDIVGGELLFDSVDISAGGAFLRSELLLEVGERVEVSFKLPGHGSTLFLHARVAWVTKGDNDKTPGMGVEFTDLKQDEIDEIRAFVGA